MEVNSVQLSSEGMQHHTEVVNRRLTTGTTASIGSITVTMDARALAPDYRIYYKNLHKFRVSQMNDGVDLRGLSDEQWGLRQLDKCHHISTTSTRKDGPQSFRVRICKTCCQEDSHIELGGWRVCVTNDTILYISWLQVDLHVKHLRTLM